MRWSPFTITLLLLILPTLGCASSVATKTAVRGSSAPAASAVATSTTAKAPRGSKVYGLNETAKVKNWDVTVTGVDRPGKELVWSQYGNTSTAAGTWFITIVEMTNTGSTNFGINLFDFELRAAGGVTYRVSTDGGAFLYSTYKGGQQLSSQVPPGVTVRYYIPFDVNPDATDLVLVFKQDTNPAFAVGPAKP